MSTGLECEFIEPEAGRWYYVLQDGSCPVQTFDWREYAHAFGPFRTYEAAYAHLSRNHANPGGHSVDDQETFRIDDTYRQLIKEARK